MSDISNLAERNALKESVKRQQEGIERLLEIGHAHTRLFDARIMDELAEKKAACDRLYRKLDKNEFEIAIVGLEKAGKSTFANALIENRILPDADERCTYTSTCIKSGSDRARVEFYTLSEFDAKLRDNLECMEFEDVEQYSVKTLTVSEYKRMFDKLSPVYQRSFENNVHADVINILENARSIMDNYLGKSAKIFTEEALHSNELRSYIVDPRISIAVKEVTVESSKLQNMPNAIIYDVPGFDSPTKMHGEQTAEHMKQADAIILIASAEKPSFTAPSLDMFNKVVDDDGVELSEKLFVFGNRADNASTLEKNIDTLKSEITKYHMMNPSCFDTRLIVGSAKAHLQEKGLDEGNFCVEKIKSAEYSSIVPYGDGIQRILDNLIEYNNTERFRILEKNVKKNNSDIAKIFKKLQEEYKDATVINNKDIKEVQKTVYKLACEANEKLKAGLEELRAEVRRDYSPNNIDNLENPKPLSNKLKELINEMLIDERYNITDEDIRRSQIALEDVSVARDIERVAGDICKDKFKKIYDDLSDNILNVAIADHKNYYDKIIIMFKDALNIRNNDDLDEKLATYVNKYKKQDEDPDVYQSLIERFVRDLVEVLILRPYSMKGRLERFKDDQINLASLMMYYTPDIANNNNAMLAIAPKDQPMLYSLLFHEYKDTVAITDNVTDAIKKTAKECLSNETIMALVLSIIKRNPIIAAAEIGKVINNVKKNSGIKNEDIARNLKDGLRTLKENLRMDNKSNDDFKYREFDFTNPNFDEQYYQFFVKAGIKNYEELQNAFEVDIKILRDFLLTVCIPAICIEKAFVAKEVNSIASLIKSIDDHELSGFILENGDVLVKHAYDEYNERLAEMAVNQEVIKKIEEVLKTLV